MSARILFCGDTHGSLRHIAPAVEAYGEIDAIVHLGDFELNEPLFQVVPKHLRSRFWWIPGNHDFDTQEYRDRLFDGGMRSRCLHLKVIEIAGLRIAGLGGIFMGRVWRPPDPPVRMKRLSQAAAMKWTHDRTRDPLYLQCAIWPKDVESLAWQRADVLVTHEAPSCHRYGYEVIDDLADKMRVSVIVHGHMHEDYEATVNAGRTQVMGVGLRGIRDIEGRQVEPSTRSAWGMGATKGGANP